MNENEFEHIAKSVRPGLVSLCRRFIATTALGIDAEDIVQETMIRMWQMRERMGNYDSPAALATMIAKNLCIDCLRHSKGRMEAVGDLDIALNDSPDSQIIGEDMARWIDESIRKLPPTQRRMLVMRSEGMSLDEIAAVCGANKSSVKTMISAARRTLTARMGGRDSAKNRK